MSTRKLTGKTSKQFTKEKAGLSKMIVPVVGTAHITLKDNEDLLGDESSLILAKTDDGFILCIADLDHDEDRREMVAGYSEALKKLCVTFAAMGFHYLRLDSVGEVLDDMEQFDW